MPRFTSCLALTAAVLTLPLIAGAQETVTPADTTGTGLIVGQVVDAASNKPPNGVVVRLSGRPAPDAIPGVSAPSALQVMTGADGRFVFRDLPKGSFTIISTKGGYLDERTAGCGPAEGCSPSSSRMASAWAWCLCRCGSTRRSRERSWTRQASRSSAFRCARCAGRRPRSAGVDSSTPARHRTDDRLHGTGFPCSIPDDYVVCVVSTQLALPASTLEEFTRGMQAGGPPNLTARASLQQALFDAGGGGAMMPAGTAGSIQVGNVVPGHWPLRHPPARGRRCEGFRVSHAVLSGRAVDCESRADYRCQRRRADGRGSAAQTGADVEGVGGRHWHPMARRQTWRCISFLRRASWGRWSPPPPRLSPIATAPSRCWVSPRASTCFARRRCRVRSSPILAPRPSFKPAPAA